MKAVIHRLFRRAPRLHHVYRQARYLAGLAYARWWADPVEQMEKWNCRRVWNYERAAEQDRYTHTLAAITRQLGAEQWGDALEVGCSDGVFTARLAPHCRSVTACDISPTACARTAERCAPYPNIHVQQLNSASDAISGCYHLVFAMDVLEMIPDRKGVRNTVAKLTAALRAGGLLVVSGCRWPVELRNSWWGRWRLEDARNRVSFLRGHSGLRLLYQEDYPETSGSIPGYRDHVIALFEKGSATHP